MKTKIIPLAAMAVALAIPGQAMAQAGEVHFKVLGTLVAPDGKIKDVKLDLIGLPAGTQTKANDNFVPTVAIEYFFADSVSVETIAGVTQHDVDGRGALAGAGLVSNAKIVPATVTLKYHFGKAGGIRPYIGAGPSYFIFIDEKPGATARALGATSQKINDTVGAALQAGVDIPVNDKGMFVSVDAKRYFMRPLASWRANGVEVLRTRHQLDPWVVSAGIGFRF
ncbi:OmpW/AlkL family protein [Blastomonas aquatica]|uniref:Outer membrane protein n=1 Tax=Blastomonas aquatica TaxID=1510276 RepID=A0ABQ1ISY9_9SPHN|nr:OmpW family outer membrane protein [Blastomonas aquatica]GGB51085.1 outer membrane protein [Blastomonas aquatica]